MHATDPGASAPVRRRGAVRRPLPLALCAAAALPFAPLAWGQPAPPAPADAAAILDRRSADYLEDALVPRPVAAVLATLRGTADAVWLDIEVTAAGPQVDPVPGIPGVPGANVRTAEELDLLLADGAVQIATRLDGRSQPGGLLAVRRGRLPVRRLEADGRLATGGTHPAELPVAATFRSAPLPAGGSWTYLVARGVPRLAVRVENVPGAAHIAAIESRGETEPALGRQP